MSGYLETLLQAPTQNEWTEINQSIHRLDQLRIQVESLSDEQIQNGFQRMSPLRLKASGTLKRGERENWLQANIFINEKVVQGLSPTWSDVLQINSLLTGQAEPIRTQAIYLGPWTAASCEDLPALLKFYECEILQNRSQQHNPVSAALAHYFLVSIHPFWDANGRTSVLIADWMLSLAGYLPQSFDSKLDAVVGHLAGKKTDAKQARAILKIMANVERSYTALFERQ